MHDLSLLYEAVVSGDAQTTRALTDRALTVNVAPLRLLNESLMPAMAEVGRRFEESEYFVPELLRSARAMKTAMALLRPLLASGGTKSVGRVVIGTVANDFHDIGKHLVAAMLEGAGFQVIDVGTSVSPEKFIEAAHAHRADIVGMSALLTTTMCGMKTTIEAFREAGVRDRFKILVGGAPVTQAFADKIGADGFSNSASGAVIVARMVMGLSATYRPGVHLCTR
jgi:5-methyltetrahydrofolate--homocysteine methyltransferase